MNKIGHTEMQRGFLIERLPEPLTAASSHLQIFDKYIETTRIRLRQVRDPYLNSWTRILQQTIRTGVDGAGVNNVSEMYLNDAEFGAFERFQGNETRKNRYFHEFDAVSYSFDVYLGQLRGLNSAKVEFESAVEMQRFVPPPFAAYEVTNEPFFTGEILAGKTFRDVQTEVFRLGALAQSISTVAED